MSRAVILKNLNSHVEGVRRLVDEKNQLIEELNGINKDLEDALFAQQCVEANLLHIGPAIQSYKEERLEELCVSIDTTLDRVFPGRGMQAKIESKIHNRKKICKLYIGKNGKFYPIKMQNGRFCRQSISFKLTSQIQEFRNAVPLLLDEPLNSGDPGSTEIISEELGLLADRGVQMVFIEHKKQSYENLKRLQVDLEYIQETGEAKVVSVHEHYN